MNLIEALVNAIRLPELRNKILFTGGILVIFRLFANVAVPGASQTALANLFNSQALLGLLDLFTDLAESLGSSLKARLVRSRSLLRRVLFGAGSFKERDELRLLA